MSPVNLTSQMIATSFRTPLLKSAFWLLAAVFVVAVVGLTATQAKTPPRHGGRSIAEWFDLEVSSAHRLCGMGPRIYDGRNAIVGMGEQAVPFLLKRANAKPSRLAAAYDDIICRLPASLMSRLPLSDNWLIPDQRFVAISLLGEITAQDGAGEDGARRVSTKTRDAVLGCLLACLAKPGETTNMRINAMQALSSFPSRKSDIVPRLLKTASEDPDVGITTAAIGTIAKLGDSSAETVSKLKELAISAADYRLQVACLQAMTRLARQAALRGEQAWNFEAIQSLQPLVLNPDRYVRLEAAVLMWQLGHPEHVTKELLSPAYRDRLCMLERLALEGTNTLAFEATVRELLDDPAPLARHTAASILSRLANGSLQSP